MEPWQELLIAALLVILALSLRSALRKNRERKNRDFNRKLETVLQARETVKLVCPSREGRWILTSKRLLLETGQGFTAVPLNTIKRVQGVNKAGNRTTAIANMVSLVVKAEKDYTIHSSTENFPELAKQLVKKAEQNKKKKAGKGNGKA